MGDGTGYPWKDVIQQKKTQTTKFNARIVDPDE